MIPQHSSPPSSNAKSPTLPIIPQSPAKPKATWEMLEAACFSLPARSPLSRDLARSLEAHQEVHDRLEEAVLGSSEGRRRQKAEGGMTLSQTLTTYIAQQIDPVLPVSLKGAWNFACAYIAPRRDLEGVTRHTYASPQIESLSKGD